MKQLFIELKPITILKDSFLEMGKKGNNYAEYIKTTDL